MSDFMPQTPDEIRRNCFGAIAHVCDDLSRCAMAQDATGVEAHYSILVILMARLETINHMQ